MTAKTSTGARTEQQSPSKLHIVLVEPEIPGNTGSVARTCAATGAVLHLVHPLGFIIDDSRLKRAGLDYWHLLDVREHANQQAAFEDLADLPLFYLSTSGGTAYSDVRYPLPCGIVLGQETSGLDRRLLKKNPEHTIRIPILAGARSLNMSNAAAIVAFEVLRQHNFPGLARVFR